MSDTPASLTNQSSKSDELVEALLKASISSASRIISRSKSTEPPRLSFAQERLWFLDQMLPGNPAYNVVRAYRMVGTLDPMILRKCFSEIIGRHEVMRTTFRSTDAGPVQIVQPYRHPKSFSDNIPPLLVSDFSNYPESVQQEQIDNFLRKELRRPFDLTKDLLLRASVIHLSKQEHILLIVMHHIISDGWSLSVILDEVSQLYGDYVRGNSSPLEELPIQYSDYAAWHRELLESDALKPSLDYWKKKLRKSPTSLNLPADFARPRIQTFEGARQFFSIPESLTDGLKQLSKEQGVTLFMFMQAAFSILLYRYSGQDDIIVGSPLANRSVPDISKLIGFFVNTIPLRIDLSGNPTFLELLSRVRKVVLEAFSNQDIPFEKIVEELQPQRDLSHSPIFQVLLVLQNMQEPTRELANVTLTPMDLDNRTAKYDLTLIVVEQEKKLHATIEYSTDLFKASTIRRLSSHFQTLLQGIVENPDRPIGELPLLSEAERNQLLVEWNDTQTDYPSDQCVHQLFESQVEKTPDATAVVFEDQSLTYRELNERANQLANYLQKRKVGPNTLVGLYLERSMEMVIGILGVLKAGGAYLPLDLEYPKERIAYMLKDSGAFILLTQNRLVHELPDQKVSLICLDTDWDRIAYENKKALLKCEINADSIAYVIYTSGSTGVPKGVMIPHRAIANHMNWMQSDYPLDESDRVLQKTPCSFDASVWEFYAPLIAGAKLILAQPKHYQDSELLIESINKYSITILQVVPMLLRMLLENDDFKSCRSLRRVFCGGEPLTGDLQKQFYSVLNADLYNLYGPTEATIDATCWHCNRMDSIKTIPIGRPIANTQTYILDHFLQPVPIGVEGELFIGGKGLALGYLNKPDLTKESFIRNPFIGNTNERLYKTGDLARYRADGNIECLGRIDHQVKIRGFRIELGEIESVLSQFTQIKKAIVTVLEDSTGGKRLVAYIGPNQDNLPDISEIRTLLKEKLPDYMIPSFFIPMEKFPLTPSGKIDRLALPKTDFDEIASDAATYIAPRTPFEKLLVEMWMKILDIKKVGTENNFFDMGGHSLLATRLVAWIQKDLDVQISVGDVFENPTITELAAKILKIRLDQD